MDKLNLLSLQKIISTIILVTEVMEFSIKNYIDECGYTWKALTLHKL